METYRNLYSLLCSYENLESAFKKARKGKTLKDCVIEFERNLEQNLLQLKEELENLTYFPAPLTTFVVRDPKTRTISASHFRDRVVHHALCNIIAPILEKDFIYDSFANQKGKGTHMAVRRFEGFMRKVCFRRTYSICGGGGGQTELSAGWYFEGYLLKADVRHYFDTVDHEILMKILKRRIRDPGVIWLIRSILENHRTDVAGKGMPIGNLTSQFFANVYLGEFDAFVKHRLKAKYYIRYVDDFVILHRDRRVLERWRREIGEFLRLSLRLELHPEKTSILPLERGVTFLGFRIFRRHKLIKKSNARRIWKRLESFREKCDGGEMTLEGAGRSLEGWMAYARFANTYALRKRVSHRFEELFGA